MSTSGGVKSVEAATPVAISARTTSIVCRHCENIKRTKINNGHNCQELPRRIGPIPLPDVQLLRAPHRTCQLHCVLPCSTRNDVMKFVHHKQHNNIFNLIRLLTSSHSSSHNSADEFDNTQLS